jgi:hypothetical protein
MRMIQESEVKDALKKDEGRLSTIRNVTFYDFFICDDVKFVTR